MSEFFVSTLVFSVNIHCNSSTYSRISQGLPYVDNNSSIKDFADISSKKKFAQEEINAPREAAQTNTVNNNLIVSTADLLKLIKGDNDG